eukprot:TRINITY_DN27018_c0_g1_i4.p1 TRINITY_DN27018_c0_g1~~TRINITY_DN27018_c0_g1_i4.p1  ORF type:complete len:498 (-),score=57.25 TRINITY_DN27018_c0_g1_i4:354-1847(-)
MYYFHFELAKKKKGVRRPPLAHLWLAAHWDKTLKIDHVFDADDVLQPSEIVFPEELPEEVWKKILGYLSLKDKKNLRSTSKSIAKAIITLEPTLREWTLFLHEELMTDLYEFMETVTRKGFSDLEGGFKLHLIIWDQRYGYAMRFARLWKDYVVSLELCPVTLCTDLTFPNLETLHIKHPFKCLDHRDTRRLAKGTVESLLVNHSTTLTRLKIDCLTLKLDLPLDLQGTVAPNLDYISLSHCNSSKGSLASLLNYARNVTKLHLSCTSTKMFTPRDLKLPRLRQLRAWGTNLRIASINADTLDTLIVEENDEGKELTNHDVQVLKNYITNNPLYNVTTLVYYESKLFPSLLPDILTSCAKSVQNLVLKEPSPFATPPVVKMENLTSLVIDTLSPWRRDIIKANAETLQYISVGEFYTYFENIDYKLPNLKEIIFLYIFNTKDPNLDKVRARFPTSMIWYYNMKMEVFIRKFLESQFVDSDLATFVDRHPVVSRRRRW